MFILYYDREFENDKKQRQAQIMEKILVEEDRIRRRKKQQPNLYVDVKDDKAKVHSESKTDSNFLDD